MTADDASDAPTQRTVAELLAKYGDSAATGRRRARREAAEVEASGSPAVQSRAIPPAPNGASTMAGNGVRHVSAHQSTPTSTLSAMPPAPPLRAEPGPTDEPATAPAGWAPAGREPARAAPEDNPTEQLPPYASWPGPPGAPATGFDEGRDGAAADPSGPSTAAIHPDELLADTGDSRAMPLDHPADYLDPREGAEAPLPAPTATAVEDDIAADGDTVADGTVADGTAAPQQARRRVDRSKAGSRTSEASPATAWLAMVAQWIAGAIGGAALWVGFRYLWSAFPVVALVAAVLVIAGLVLLVRAIRRSDDLKTTVFAVLVGLVVTVSPAVLVLVTR